MTASTYIGKPCKRGHYGERNSKTKGCVECAKEYRSEQPTKKKRHKLKAITITVPGKPVGRAKRYDPMIRPPVLRDQPETVEEFLARGGQVKSAAVGVSGYKL